MHSSRVHLMVTPEEVMAHRDDVVKCASGNKKYACLQKVGLTRINGVSGLEILSTAQLVRLSLTANNNSV